MTVAELIEELQVHPRDLEVRVANEVGYFRRLEIYKYDGWPHDEDQFLVIDPIEGA